MEHTGHVKIDDNEIPFHLVDNKVTLIPYDTYSTLIRSKVKEQEILYGVTTGNREVAFVNCRYNKTSLGYEAFVYSASNTGMVESIERFDRISFTGKPVNVFAEPGSTHITEEGHDISKRMLSITPREWEEINFYTNIDLDGSKVKLSIDYYIKHNLMREETSIGNAIPRLFMEFDKPMHIKEIPKIYLMVFDFFAFLNFRRNITFDNIVLQCKTERGFDNNAYVLINQKQNEHEYDNKERNSIVANDCKSVWGELFKTIASRRVQKIYDNFFIPIDSYERSMVSYEKFLSCALSFESEYSRTHPTKKEENEKFELVHRMVKESADKISSLFDAVRNGDATFADFEKCFYGDVNEKYNEFIKEFSKNQAKDYNKPELFIQ